MLFSLFFNDIYHSAISSATFIRYHTFRSMSIPFVKKIKSSYLEDLISAEGGIWTLAPRKRSIPLAGAPLQPLEYFCKCLNINIFNCIRHSHDAWISYQSNFLLSIGFDWLFYFFEIFYCSLIKIIPLTINYYNNWKIFNS